MGLNSRLRTTLALGLALIVVAIAVAMVVLAGDDGDAASAGETSTSSTPAPTASSEPSHQQQSESPDDSKKGSSDTTKGPSDTGVTVARKRFCPDIDPAAVSETLGAEGLEVLSDRRPGEKYSLGPGLGDTTSEQWSCTIGVPPGTSLAVTWSIWGEPADRALLNTRLKSQKSQLGTGCESIEDELLGPATQGLDCAAEQGGEAPGFAAVSRMALAGDSLLECFLGSTDPDDMPTLQAAAPEICGLFLDTVTG